MNRLVVAIAILLVVVYPTPNTISLAMQDQYPQAPWPTHQWSKATPEEQGMNSSNLELMLNHYLSNEIQIDGLLVIRNGFVVLEEYPANYGPEDIHHLFSCTKSVTSTLVGIASNLGYLASIDDSVLGFFSGYNISNPSQRKDAISIGNLLTMTTGISWDEEHYGQDLNDYNKMVRSDDWIQYVLDKPMTSNPGEFFYYNSGASHLLSAIIQQSTGNSTLDFAIENLFEPLGITEYEWGMDPKGIYSGASGLKLKPSDMAKIGYLYLREGLWEGIQILPQDWVQTSSTLQVQVDEILGYSYQWWVLPELGVYYALGWGYQSIIIVPSYDLVIVVTAATLDSSVEVESILKRWILPSLGVDSTIYTPVSISPLFLLVSGGPFFVLAIAYIMDRFGLWEEMVEERIRKKE